MSRGLGDVYKRQLLNGVLGWVGDWFGVQLSFELVLGYVFAPVAWLLGCLVFLGMRPSLQAH